MKNLEGGLNPDHLSSERHVYGGTFELDFIPFHFRRGIRHADARGNIVLPAMPRTGYDRSYEVLSEWAITMDIGVVDGVNGPIDVKDRECFAGLTSSTIP